MVCISQTSARTAHPRHLLVVTSLAVVVPAARLVLVLPRAICTFTSLLSTSTATTPSAPSTPSAATSPAPTLALALASTTRVRAGLTCIWWRRKGLVACELVLRKYLLFLLRLKTTQVSNAHNSKPKNGQEIRRTSRSSMIRQPSICSSDIPILRVSPAIEQRETKSTYLSAP